MAIITFKDYPNTETPINAENINDTITALLDIIHPIGSIYITTISTNPATVFGFGTWEAWGSGRVPVGVDADQTEFNTVGKSGGAKTHTLTVAQMPSHHHYQYVTTSGSDVDANRDFQSYGPHRTVYQTLTSSVGGGQAHNNLQPYITCYMFKRTA